MACLATEGTVTPANGRRRKTESDEYANSPKTKDSKGLGDTVSLGEEVPADRRGTMGGSVRVPCVLLAVAYDGPARHDRLDLC